MTTIIINLLLVAFVVVSRLLILVVLMQRPKQEGLGAAFGSGMTDQMFGAQTTRTRPHQIWFPLSKLTRLFAPGEPHRRYGGGDQ